MLPFPAFKHYSKAINKLVLLAQKLAITHIVIKSTLLMIIYQKISSVKES